MKNQSKHKPIDLSQCKPMETKSSRRGVVSISVVSTRSNGKRIKFSHGLMEKLGNPTDVQFRIQDNKIIIGSQLNEDDKSYRFSESNSRTLYNASIVANFTEVLSLDFSSVTSVALSNIRFRKAETESGEIVRVAVVRKNDDLIE